MTRFNRADVWVLLGPHRGDNNQLLALAESLGVPFRPIELRYRWFAHLPAVARSITVSQLRPDARQAIAPPWPSLVLGIGQRSAPVARYIQRESGGRAKIVRLGDPMVSHRLFDLVITTTQYAVRDADNVVRLPITITDQDEVRPNQLEERWLQRFARPRRLVVIGGKTSLWQFDTKVVSAAAQSLRRRAGLEGGSVIAVTSPRTSPELVAAARGALGEEAVITDAFPRYGALLAAADEIHVTGDSVSMLSDAIASGKPVGLIPLEPDFFARFVRMAGAIRGSPVRVRDLDKFWDDLRARGLVGTVDDPRSGTLNFSPIDLAIAAIRAVIDDRSPEPVKPVRVPAARATVPAAKAMTL
jgi:mitochondrial fission protein ELM1